MNTDEYCRLLGVNRGASREALRRAFRSRLFEAHPDLNPGDRLAQDRTRQIVEAYHALSNIKTAPAPDLTPARTARPVTLVYQTARTSPEATTRSVLWVAAVVVLLCLVLTCARLACDDASPVMRPDLAKLTAPADTKTFPILVEPHISDAVQWYHAQEYQLSLASNWATRQTLNAYELAARRAALRKDGDAVRFYQDAIRHIRHAVEPAPMQSIRPASRTAPSHKA